ncbi:MAG: hypothetical protein LLG14_05715 [Nocardiaceae bacterium]|nr:hypothetical protein [Nocardiaceae bacterium]
MAKKSCLVWPVPVAAIALLISGCADNVKTDTATREQGDQPSATANADENLWIGGGNVDAELFRASPRDDAFYRFVSPTKNLACGFNLHSSGYEVGCQSPDVPKPEPRVGADPCNEAGVTITAYSVQHVCLPALTHGGEPGTRVLEYGQVIRVGDIACRSEATGMTCQYGQRGFTLSRDKVVVF